MQVLKDDTLSVDDRRRLQVDLSQQFQQLQKRLMTAFDDGNDEVCSYLQLQRSTFMSRAPPQQRRAA